MPNWCSNKLTVSGPKAMLDKFIAEAKLVKPKTGEEPTELSLDKLFPTPSEADIKKTVLKFKDPLLAATMGKSTPDWYTWRVANWGTKWDVTAWVAKKEDKKIQYEFDSAWSPPIDAFTHISENYPDLKFELKYREEGMGFKGRAVMQDGELVSEA